jgi:hypothetical protein
MLGVNQLDFINYCNALKGNYRKGVHKMETLLENPTHAKEFANNLGGVSVVLGTPVGKEDRNSETLRSMLLASDVANDAVYTWMGQFYEFSSWDDLLSDASRCNEIMNDPLKSRAVSGSGVAVGKMVATIAGLSCSAYADMSAVAASSTAMTAIASSQTAMAAVASSQTAMAAVAASQTAMTAVASSQTAMTAIQKSQTALNAIAASSMATAKYAAGAAGLNPADYADMTAIASSSTAMTAVINNATALNAVVSSQTAMAAIFRSSTALQVVQNNASAWAIFSNASSAVMGKTVAELAGLNPSGYADMNAIASSSTAMTAVCSSALAFNAALKNSTARTQLAGSSYLQSNYDKLLSTVGNSTYFSQKFDNIDSGAKRAISGGNTDTTATANESVFLCKKIGAWSNGNSVTGTVAHLQTKTTAGSISTRAGGGQSTDDYTTGGVQAKYICIGGCTFTENGDAYCCGIFAFAK